MIFSPVLGIAPTGGVFRYPMLFIDAQIDRVIDLRLPSTLDWLWRTFIPLECSTAFRFDTDKNFGMEWKNVLSPPKNPTKFLPMLLDQSLGEGTPFIQGIGAWLRAAAANALIYPSGRSDSRGRS